MKQSFIIFATSLLIISAPRFPAPIQEIPESPASATKEQTKPKKTQSRKAESESKPESAPKPSARPMLKGFAGNWTGTALGVVRTFPIGDKNNSTYSIHISADEKTLSLLEQGDPHGDVRQPQIACRREGDILTWNYKKKGSFFSNPMNGTCTLRINSNGTASLAEERNVIMKITGTLIRQ